jgi:hypothetical protein
MHRRNRPYQFSPRLTKPMIGTRDSCAIYTHQSYSYAEHGHAGSASVEVKVVGLARQEAAVKGDNGDLDKTGLVAQEHRSATSHVREDVSSFTTETRRLRKEQSLAKQ